jgi:TonB family protein
MTQVLIHWLWESALASSAATLLVLVLRAPLRRMWGARAAYMLWALVPTAMLAVSLPAPQAPAVVVASAVPAASVVPHDIVTAPVRVAAASIDAEGGLFGAWLAGMLAFAALCAWRQRRFVRRLGRLQRRGDGHWQSMHADIGPAVLGSWRGRVVLPADFDRRYSEHERELVLRHEHAHLRRHDPLANLVAIALRTVYWFNPLLHVAFARFRFDQELAVDATVLARRPGSRRSYADAMLKAQFASGAPPLGCHWQAAHPLAQRIRQLSRPQPGIARHLVGLACTLLLTLGSGYAAWAGQSPDRTATTMALHDAVMRVRVFRQDVLVADPIYTVKSGTELDVDLPEGLALNLRVEHLRPERVRVAAALRRDDETIATPMVEGVPGAGVMSIERAAGPSEPPLRIELDVSALPSLAASIWRQQQIAASGRRVTLNATASSLRDAIVLLMRDSGLEVENLELAPSDGESVNLEFDRTPALEALSSLLADRSDINLMITIDGGVSLVAVADARSQAPVPRSADQEARMPAPAYPPQAILRRAEGLVMLKVRLDAGGRPLQVELDAEATGAVDPLLIAAARDAVQQWQFASPQASDDVVEHWVRVPIEFRLPATSFDAVPSAASPKGAS